MALKVDPRVPDAQAADLADKVLIPDAPSDAEVLLCDLRVAGRQVRCNHVEIVQDLAHGAGEGDPNVMPLSISQHALPARARDREVEAAKGVDDCIKAGERDRVLGAPVTPAYDGSIWIAVPCWRATAGIDGPAAGIDGPAIAASNFWRRRRGSVSDGRDAGCGHHASKLKAEAKQGLPGLLRLSEKGHHARRLGLFFGRNTQPEDASVSSNGDATQRYVEVVGEPRRRLICDIWLGRGRWLRRRRGRYRYVVRRERKDIRDPRSGRQRRRRRRRRRGWR